MLVPGLTFSGNEAVVARSLGQVANQILQGFGFLSDGVTLALDTTAVPSPVPSFTKGIAQNASGAAYTVTVQNATDVWVEGIRVSAAGAIVVEVNPAVEYASGNPITANGNFAVSQ